MDLPAIYYGQLDGRNPVISGFKRDIKSFLTLMKRVASLTVQDNSSKAKGIKIFMEIRSKYKHRLPELLYQEHMMRIADFLCEIKLYQLALWHGYGSYLLQFSSVKITEITGTDHFMASFFPEGFDEDQDVFALKIRAMLGCVLCIFEHEKRCSTISQKGLCKLLHVLNFIRIMMQAFQQLEHLSWLIYDGSLHIYNICRYLMTMKCGEQALEYLLWASISLELSVPLMTTKYLPLIATLYCAVCYCSYDNQAEVQAEEFAKRALRKINDLSTLEQKSELATMGETQRAYKEASIKLGALVFKRAVFVNRRKPQIVLRQRPKNTLKDIPNGPWPHTETECMLSDQFDCSAGQFLGILETLWDSNSRLLEMNMPDDAELKEVILELLAAGTSILSGGQGIGEKQCDEQPYLSPLVLTTSSTLMDLAITGEDKVPIMSVVRFIKLFFHYKQPEVFTKLVKEMLQLLSGMEGQAFRRAERELTLLHSLNNLLFPQRGHPKETIVKDDQHKPSLLISDALSELVDTLHLAVCGSDPEQQPGGDLALDMVLFLWEKLKVFSHQTPEFTDDVLEMNHYDKWLRCLSLLCEVAFACELETVDCIVMAEMIQTLGIQLEKAARCFNQTQGSGCENVKASSFSILASSSTDLLKMVCDVVEKGLQALSRGVSTLLPQDSSAVTDSAFMQKYMHVHSLRASSALSEEETGEAGISMKEEDINDEELKSDFKGCEQIKSISTFLVAKDLHLELNVIHHKASLKLQQQNEVSEAELLDRIKRNKVYKAHFLIQKALLEHNTAKPNESSTVKSLLEEAAVLIEKAEREEIKLYKLMLQAQKTNEGVSGKGESPPPPPILISRTDYSLTFVPAPYNLEGKVSWYQLCGRVAEGINLKVRLGDVSIPGTGNMVPVVSGNCVLKVEGLQPNQKYMFAVAAYNSQGKLLGNSIGKTSLPVLASMPVLLLSTWAHLAQVAFETQQYVIAKRACQELWSHYTDSDCNSTQDRFAATGLYKPTLQHSSPHLCQLFLTSIFIETEISIRQGSLCSLSSYGKFTWEQEVRLAECERMLLAMEVAMCLNDGRTAVQAAVTCYRLLGPLIFHQISYDPVVQVMKKCLVVLEENTLPLNQKCIGTTSESLTDMVACITNYLSKALHLFGKYQMDAAVMECGCNLLKEVYDANLKMSRLSNQAKSYRSVTCPTVSCQTKIYCQFSALQRKNKKKIISDPALYSENKILQPLNNREGLSVLYDLIQDSTLQQAHQYVMKIRCKTYFLEFAVQLLWRTIEEGHPELVLNWGESILQFLSRREEVLRPATINVKGNDNTKHTESVQAAKGNEILQQDESTLSYDASRRKLRRKLPLSLLRSVRTIREVRLVENLLNKMSYVVQRNKRKIQLRNMCSEERVWKSNINYCMAQAHLVLFYQGLKGAPQQRYSQFDPLWFSLAHSGVLMKRKSQPQQSSGHNTALEKESSFTGDQDHVRTPNKERMKKEADKADDSETEECLKKEEKEGKIFQTVEQQTETHLESLQKAALYLRRAMVLAHRGSHWTTLQHLCQTVWDQSCKISSVLLEVSQIETHSPVTADQVSMTFTPLLIVAADLIMDMMTKLELWSVYDRNLTEKETESSLHFSASLDDGTLVDLRWVRTLVFHTLELLHDSGKWESLAHFALLFNSYTHEHYTLIVAPLLLHAQRKLLERINYSGGPAVPQPHHVKTQMVTGKEVNYKSYVGCQLVCGWTPSSAQKQPVLKNAARSNATRGNTVRLKGSEKQLSMSLVCVPLDVENTLSFYRQALERTPQSLLVLRHSRSLLVQLLAHAQPCMTLQLSHCQNVAVSVPNILPCELSEEDFSDPHSIYVLPISPEYSPAVAAAYANSIKCLQASGHDSLSVLALHELGNLHFYTGNTRSAHSCWSKAVDCTFQTAGVLEKWDGVSFGGGSLQQTIKQAGVWGCLQAAVLTAKIAQFILTSNISQRTKCCLLSAHLFKCVLCGSVARPQADVQYASYTIGDELLPGVDLFSDPHRLHIGTTVTSLNFICHWLFTAGYYITLLPILSLYLHLVGNVCKDVQRCVEGKILKVRTLTELCLFTEAVTEAVQLTLGADVILPHEHPIVKVNIQPVKKFYSNKSLQDNLEALEDLVNCDFATDVHTLYGPTLYLRFNLARIQLVLALANSECGRPAPDSEETCANTTSCLVNSGDHEQEMLKTEDPKSNNEKPKYLSLCSKREKLSPERIKCGLLEAASCQLSAAMQQLTSLSCSETEKVELTVQSKLLTANLYLQQGRGALSCEVAASSLTLLQTSPVVLRGFGLASEQDTKDSSVSDTLYEDCPTAAEAGERIGVSLWLRCRLTLVQSLAANIPDTAALFPGKNINEEKSRVVQEGLDECVQWGDVDIQALLMVEGAELDAQRGKKEDSMTKSQGAMSLLSGRTCIPPASVVTLARAVLLLSDQEGAQSAKLLKVSQKLLKKQLCAFGQSFADGLSNIYLPYFDILNKIIVRIDQLKKSQEE